MWTKFKILRGQDKDGAVNLPRLQTLALAVADEVAVLAGVAVAVNGDEEPLVELEGAWELLHQLPHTHQELSQDGRNLFGVSNQVIAPGQEVRTVRWRQNTILIEGVKPNL